MSLRTRVLALIAAILALILALAWQLALRYQQSSSSLNQVVDQLAPAAAATSDLQTSIHDMDRRLHLYVARESPGYRRLYRTAVQKSADDLDTLVELRGDHRGTRELLTAVKHSRQAWLDNVGDPALAAATSGEFVVAQDILDSEQAQAGYSRLTADAYRLQEYINRATHKALDESARAGRRLAWTMVAALLLLLLVPVMSFLVLRRSVLQPIAGLRRQLRAAAEDSEHKSVITPTGPPELLELGTDAEALRRRLVEQIDNATAAQSALAQESPVVHAIRTELHARDVADNAGVQVAGVLRPAEGVLAGDFWDRIPLGDGRTAVVVCDVSGHGPRAGIVAMRIKTSITMGLLSGADAPSIFHRACDGFADEPARFATAVILIADPATGLLTWVNAGHPQPRIVRLGGEIERLGTTGPMLSWLGGVWAEGSTRLRPSEVVLAFSDGVLESRGEDGEELGDDGLDERVAAAVRHTTDPAEVISHALAGVRERAETLARDDVTLVALRLDPAAAAIPEPRR
ncbi:MAG: PP2C family protein-serine/threonine phosphatase [Candidatus Nanopelagicales bacterium]